MAEEFEGRDLRGAIFWDVDLQRALFRDVNLSEVTISHARVVDVDIDGFVQGVTINGVDVTDYVNAGDWWYPLRAMLRPEEPEGMRAAWVALEDEWSGAIERARRLDDRQRHESVAGEWSFVQTLRHLVFAMDKWFTHPILGEGFDPCGLPNTFSVDFPWPGLDRTADPTFDQVLDVREVRAAKLRDYLAALTVAVLDQGVVVLENGPASVRECLHTVFEEEFQHLRYAARDLAHVEGSSQ